MRSDLRHIIGQAAGGVARRRRCSGASQSQDHPEFGASHGLTCRTACSCRATHPLDLSEHRRGSEGTTPQVALADVVPVYTCPSLRRDICPRISQATTCLRPQPLRLDITKGSRMPRMPPPGTARSQPSLPAPSIAVPRLTCGCTPANTHRHHCLAPPRPAPASSSRSTAAARSITRHSH
jgi:hypothetical protein